MKIIPAVDHDVPVPKKGIVIHICQRESLPNLIIRKFKSTCGNTLEVHVTRKSGFIRSITPLYTCQSNCSACYERIEAIKILIAKEHQSS